MRCGMHCITSCMELWSCLSLYLPLARRCWTVTWMYVLHATLGAVGCFWCSSPSRAQVLVFTALSMSPLENALATGPRLARVQAVTLNNGVTSGRRTSVDFYVSTWDEQPPNSDANAEDWVGKEMDRRGLRPLGSVDDEYGRRRLATAVSRGDIPWADGDVAGLAGPHGERSAAAEMYTEALYLFPDGVSLSYVHPCERRVCLVLTLTFPARSYHPSPGGEFISQLGGARDFVGFAASEWDTFTTQRQALRDAFVRSHGLPKHSHLFVSMQA